MKFWNGPVLFLPFVCSIWFEIGSLITYEGCWACFSACLCGGLSSIIHCKKRPYFIYGKIWSKIKSKDSFEYFMFSASQNCSYFWFWTMFYQFRLNTPRVKRKLDLFKISPFNFQARVQVMVIYRWTLRVSILIYLLDLRYVLSHYLLSNFF